MKFLQYLILWILLLSSSVFSVHANGKSFTQDTNDFILDDIPEIKDNIKNEGKAVGEVFTDDLKDTAKQIEKEFNDLFKLQKNLNITDPSQALEHETKNANNSWTTRNNSLERLWDDSFINTQNEGGTGIKNFLFRIAKDMKNLFFAVATVFYLVIVIRVLLSGNIEEEVTKFKTGIIWITLGIVVMQLAYSFTVILFNKEIWGTLAFELIDNLIFPLIRLIETLVAFFFLAIAIFAFYQLVTANGNEDNIKKAKTSIIQAVIWYIIIKFSKLLVTSVYGKVYCDEQDDGVIDIGQTTCIEEANLEGSVWIIVDIITWLNSFVIIVVILMVLYAGILLFFSEGEEEKIKKVKNILLYIVLGMILLVTNYLIFTFFILPEATI